MEDIQVARCIVRSYNKQKILLVRRAFGDNHSPGLWECPGGKLEEGHDHAYTAVEEVRQETGLAVVLASDFVEVDRNEMTTGKYAGKTYICSFALAVDPSRRAPVVLSCEHTESRWVSYEEAIMMDLTPQTLKGLASFENQLKTPE